MENDFNKGFCVELNMYSDFISDLFNKLKMCISENSDVFTSQEFHIIDREISCINDISCFFIQSLLYRLDSEEEYMRLIK